MSPEGLPHDPEEHRAVMGVLANAKGAPDGDTASAVLDALRRLRAQRDHDSVGRVARTLATLSEHPRYGGDDGWEMILQTPGNVVMAHAAALRALRTPSQADVETLNDLRAGLLTWHRSQGRVL